MLPPVIDVAIPLPLPMTALPPLRPDCPTLMTMPPPPCATATPVAIVTRPPCTVELLPPKIRTGPPLICPLPATMDTEPPVAWLDVPAFSATDAVVDGYDPVAPATMDTVPAEYVDPVELPVCRLTAPGVARHRQQPHR